jgi:hypothetical protein
MDNIKPIVEGRSCGNCTLCCKLLKITETEKPQGLWCKQCTVGAGCKIYSSKPSECTNFYCEYLLNPELDERWKPSSSKIIITLGLNGNRIEAHVDQSRPDAWRQEAYYSAFKHWARMAAPHRGQVIVCVGRRTYMILPDRDVDLGNVSDDEFIITGERTTPTGIRLEAYKIHKNDPRAPCHLSVGWKAVDVAKRYVIQGFRLWWNRNVPRGQY